MTDKHGDDYTLKAHFFSSANEGELLPNKPWHLHSTEKTYLHHRANWHR